MIKIILQKIVKYLDFYSNYDKIIDDRKGVRKNMQGYEQDNSAAKKTFFSIVAVLTLVMAVAGGTFAFFAASANNAGTVNGTAGAPDLGLSVTLASAAETGTGKMVPLNVMVDDQTTANATAKAALKSALLATKQCVDANNNTSCKVYKITVTNSGDTSVNLKGFVSFADGSSGSAFANLYMDVLSSATAPTATASIQKITLGTGTNNIVNSVVLAANASKDYYIAVWIEETGSDQTSTDHGSFKGTVTFNSSTGEGVTSTFA